MFPAWFVGIAFAAIGIGALVPAAIMSIAAANLYTRNIHREFINRQCIAIGRKRRSPRSMSLVVKIGALVFIIYMPTQYAIQLQLLGGIWIIQTLPAVMIGALYALVQCLGAADRMGSRAPPPAPASHCLEPRRYLSR